MARAALSRRALDGPCAVMYRPSGATPVCVLATRWAIYSPYRLPLDGPFILAKTDPYQRRRPADERTLNKIQTRKTTSIIFKLFKGDPPHNSCLSYH